MSDNSLSDLEAVLAGLVPASSSPPWESPAPVVKAQPVTPPTSITVEVDTTMAQQQLDAVIEKAKKADADLKAVAAVAAVDQPAAASWGGTPKDEHGLVAFVDPVELKRDVNFDLSALDEAIRAHAANFVHYATQAARARHQYESVKAKTQITEAQLYAHHREALLGDGKKATEAQVDAAIKMDPRWLTAQERLIAARLHYDLANEARSAFEQRKDMLVQVSVDRRTEAQGELRIRAAQEAGQAARKDAFLAGIGAGQ